jgi:pyrimidine-specific ribonucleoside hydrolase
VGSAPGPLLFEGKKLRDFNYSMDPRALSVIVQYSRIPITAVTFGASSSTGLPTSVVDSLAASSQRKARYFGRASQPYARWWEERIAPIKPVWDASVVWYALHPEDLECATGGIQLGLGPPNTFSDDVYDWIDPSVSGGRPVTACTTFADAFAITRMNDAVLSAVGAD